MMKLTDVSRTAVVTLRSRVLESQRENPLIADPMAGYCLEKLIPLATEEEKALLFDRKLPSTLTNHIALRARKYDSIVNDFIPTHPMCTVINLGCGFDTRYWRIDHTNCEYIELDLPELVELKKEVLLDRLNYKLIGCSVLDYSWIDEVTSNGNRNFLLIAEGLLMYLPKEDVIGFFATISKRFCHSRIVLEVVQEKYTHGLWKKIVEMKMKQATGFDAGSSYNFGVRTAREIESYGSGIKVTDEWSYLDDDDVRPKILKYFRRFKSLTRSQWTVTASVNEDG